MCGVCMTRESCPEGTLYIVRHILERPLGTRFSRHTYPTHRTFVLMCGVKAPVGEDVPLGHAASPSYK